MSTITPAGLSAGSLVRPVLGSKGDEVLNNIATEVVSYTGRRSEPGVLTARDLAPLRADATQLRQRLMMLLPDHNAHQSMLVAGSILTGPHGVLLTELMEKLHTAARVPAQTVALAQAIETLQQAGTDTGRLDVARLQSLGGRSTQALLEQQVPPDLMPAGLFLAGAFTRHTEALGLTDT